jgi:hydrogenase expression/formation protein HypC
MLLPPQQTRIRGATLIGGRSMHEWPAKGKTPMCLAVPAKIVQLEGPNATVDLHGNRVQISTMLTPEAQLGDWVLVHAGFAIQRLDEAAAAETFAILQDVERAARPPAATAKANAPTPAPHLSFRQKGAVDA